jgi:hypothetical protein
MSVYGAVGSLASISSGFANINGSQKVITEGYCCIDGVWKSFWNYLATWSASVNAPMQCELGGGCGSKSAGLMAGGWYGSSSNHHSSQYSYNFNGTSWYGGVSFGTAVHQLGLCGSQTAALLTGGTNWSSDGVFRNTYTYNGTSWTGISNSIPNPRSNHGSCGSQNSALVFGGAAWNTTDGSVYPGGGVSYLSQRSTIYFDGVSWYNKGDMLVDNCCSGGGRANDALAIHYEYPVGCSTESFNGTSWSMSANRNIARGGGGRMSGNSSAEISVFAGESLATEHFNGTVWVTGNNMSIDRSAPQVSSASSDGFCTGGASSDITYQTGGITGTTETFSRF